MSGDGLGVHHGQRYEDLFGGPAQNIHEAIALVGARHEVHIHKLISPLLIINKAGQIDPAFQVPRALPCEFPAQDWDLLCLIERSAALS